MAFSGFQDFNPNFSEALQAMMAERPGITINSGYRTPQRQAELFAAAIQKYGSPEAARIHVAPAPGTYGSKGSRHNFGLAADLAYATPEDRAWAHENAARYGLNFRMGHEPWHIELAGKAPQSVAQTGSDISPSNNQTAYMALTEQPRQLKDSYFTPAKPVAINLNPGLVTNAPMEELGTILALADMISPKRSGKADQILKSIRDYV